MLSDQINRPVSLGFLTLDIKTDTSVQGVLDCLNLKLPLFAERQKGETEIVEDGLTQRLCMFLTRHSAEFPFHFKNEFMEDDRKGNSPRIDVGVYAQNEKIVVNN